MAQYLIFAGKHAAIIDVPRSMSSDGYGELQKWFSSKTHAGREYADMRSLWSYHQINGVWYHEELAGAAGASFEVFHLPDNTQESIDAAKHYIRRSFDVVYLRVRKFDTMHDIQEDVNRIASDDAIKAGHC